MSQNVANVANSDQIGMLCRKNVDKCRKCRFRTEKVMSMMSMDVDDVANDQNRSDINFFDLGLPRTAYNYINGEIESLVVFCRGPTRYRNAQIWQQEHQRASYLKHRCYCQDDWRELQVDLWYPAKIQT